MKKNDTQLYALIYNRVSSVQQESEGSGLESQEQRCIKYAESKDYIVEKERIFHDTFSGGGDFMRRPAMRDLLEYIDNNPQKKYVVIFDDLKRFARDTKFHIELRGAFNVRKAKVECLNFNFEDTPEGNFVETILAAQNQLEREQNQRQVIQKQKSRLESGYWAFNAPIGYDMKKVQGYSGKIAVPNEKGEFIKEALEGYASFKFVYITDAVNFLKAKGVLREARAEKYIRTVKSLLANPFYSGYIEYEPWEVTKRKGVHVPLIDESTYFKNLERLNKPTQISKIRKDDSTNFELRRLINCFHCNKPFTGAESRGRSKYYGYYFCQNKACLMNKKSVLRDDLDIEFKNIMNNLIPTQEVIAEFKDLFEECWKDAIINFSKNNTYSLENIQKLESDIERYVELVGTTTNQIVRNRYEEKIETLDKEIKSIKQKSAISIDLSIPYRTALEKILVTAQDPYKSWTGSNPEAKKKLYHFFFEENIRYDVKNGYRTVKPSILYRYLDDLAKKAVYVEMEGVEVYDFSTGFKFSQILRILENK